MVCVAWLAAAPCPHCHQTCAMGAPDSREPHTPSAGGESARLHPALACCGEPDVWYRMQRLGGSRMLAAACFPWSLASAAWAGGGGRFWRRQCVLLLTSLAAARMCTPRRTAPHTQSHKLHPCTLAHTPTHQPGIQQLVQPTLSRALHGRRGRLHPAAPAARAAPAAPAAPAAYLPNSARPKPPSIQLAPTPLRPRPCRRPRPH
jgi:hypothetical protein